MASTKMFLCQKGFRKNFYLSLGFRIVKKVQKHCSRLLNKRSSQKSTFLFYLLNAVGMSKDQKIQLFIFPTDGALSLRRILVAVCLKGSGQSFIRPSLAPKRFEDCSNSEREASSRQPFRRSGLKRFALQINVLKR